MFKSYKYTSGVHEKYKKCKIDKRSNKKMSLIDIFISLFLL